ncbi:MAG: DUF4007 family protein [bacterium]|nr:DUF4007 family protein [bacterium]
MRLVDAARPMFARHETFHPRYGWFRKAYSFAVWDRYVFTRKDAPVVIGVGKNMVRAIRFWGLAAKLLVEDPSAPNRRSPGLVPTRIGNALFGEMGWDPFTEDPGTLWLLQWLLLAPRSRLPVWWLAFNDFNAVEFDDNALDQAVEAQLEALSSWKTPHPTSRKKDVRALLRTYGPPVRSARTSIDDILDCPLRELNLIEISPATGRYRFVLGPKPTLPSEVVAYAALDYIARTGAAGNTVTLSRLAYDSGAPGRAFKLSETELLQALEPTLDRVQALDLVTPTGAAQLSWHGDPTLIAVDVLNGYYQASPPDMRAGTYGDQPVDAELIDALGLGSNPSEAERELQLSSGIVIGGR